MIRTRARGRTLVVAWMSSFALLSFACNQSSKTHAQSTVAPKLPAFMTDVTSPLYWCVPYATSTPKTIHVFNFGSADLVVTNVSFVDTGSCSMLGVDCATIGFDKTSFTLPAGDTKGMAVIVTVTCPADTLGVDIPLGGTIAFSTNALSATALAVSGVCTADVATCCLLSRQCCPSTANPICTDFSDPVYYDQCLQACCHGTNPPPGC